MASSWATIAFTATALLLIVTQPVMSIDEEAYSKIVPHLNHFSFMLYKGLCGSQKSQENVFFSPLSVYQSLALLVAGSDGNTRDELLSTLAGRNDDFGHEALGGLIGHLLTGTNGVSLQLANRLWTDKKFSILSEYNELVKKCYGVKVEQVDFAESEKCRVKINKWISKITKDNIKELLQKGTVNPQTMLLITNAIHFKGLWNETFDEKRTKTEEFTFMEGKSKKTVKAKFMRRMGKILYNRVESTDLQVIDLPYGSGKFSMSVFLPAEESAHASLKLSEIQEAMKDMKPIRMELMLPKFKIDAKYDLEKVLPELGLKSLFSSGANFKRLTKDSISVTKVVHQAVISVDEKGTEASAATAVAMGRSFIPMFKANRPFTFLIRERDSGAILFLGKLNKPEASD